MVTEEEEGRGGAEATIGFLGELLTPPGGETSDG